MKTICYAITVIVLLIFSLDGSAQTNSTADFWAGKWKLMIENLPQGDPQMIINLERKNGKFEGNVMDSAMTEVAKFSRVEEKGNSITLFFTAQGYDVNLELEKRSEDSVAGSLMGMFETKGARYKSNMSQSKQPTQSTQTGQSAQADQSKQSPMPGQSKRVLVFSKTKGFRHESIEAGINAFTKLGADNNIQVDFTEDASRFNAADLKNYQAIVFLNTTGDVLDNTQQGEFEKYIKSGGGYLGIHAAADCEYDWPWYGQLVGAWFLDHPSSPSNVQKGKFIVVDKKHASTAAMPETFERSDEFYSFKSINPAIHPLIRIDEKSYQGGKNGANHPMSWYHDFDGGRSFYINMGHTKETFSEPMMLKHIWEGLKYAMGTKAS